ncbi:GNAT family N-acetyltransferase [Haloprofundus salilacus]|uniref:GNAT family N-acetyltransferase n=1 Tax=Haloprofundus salilacus TaxID=2876190 RepID=UPI001CCF480D|nr:GNAT family N-acetyltransferase [Haloprofundus salilacus]
MSEDEKQSTFTNSSHEMGQKQERYSIRGYVDADRAAFCELFESEWFGVDEEWFEWRYSSPYLDEKAIAVATDEGTPVGFFPCMVFPLRARGMDTIGLQPASVLVHQDHRKRGLFTKLARWLFETYDDAEPSVFFNFPNAAVSPGLKKLGWREATTLPSYFRVQNPNAVLRCQDRGLGRACEAALKALSRAYFACCRQFRSRSSDMAVTRHSTVPAEEFASLYAENVPDRIHVPRDPTFYRWRYDVPKWNHTAYVARDDGPVAGVVAGTHRTENGLLVTSLMEAQPMGVTDRNAAFERLLHAVAADHPGSHLIEATRATLPRSAALQSGFLADDELPMSALRGEPTAMLTRPVSTDGREWRLNGLSLTDPDSWQLMLSERDPIF